MRFLAANDSADEVSEGYVLTMSLEDLLALHEAATTYVAQFPASTLIDIIRLREIILRFEDAVEA